MFFIFPLIDLAPLRKEENQHRWHKPRVPVEPIGLEDPGAVFHVRCRGSAGLGLYFGFNKILPSLKGQDDDGLLFGCGGIPIIVIIITGLIIVAGFGGKGEIGGNSRMDSHASANESDYWHRFLTKLFWVLLHSLTPTHAEALFRLLSRRSYAEL